MSVFFLGIGNMPITKSLAKHKNSRTDSLSNRPGCSAENIFLYNAVAAHSNSCTIGANTFDHYIFLCLHGDVLRRDNIRLCAGNLLHQHLTNLHRSRYRNTLQRFYNIEDFALRDVAAGLA